MATTKSAIYLAANIRAIRKRLRMNQSDFARHIGMPQSRVSELENASSDKRLSLIDELASRLAISTTELIKPTRRLPEDLQEKLDLIDGVYTG